MAEMNNSSQLGIILVDLGVCCNDLDLEVEKAIAEATKKYLEDTSRSRGGKLTEGGFEKNPLSENLQYVVHFANRKSAERLLKNHHRPFQVNQRWISLTVQLCPSEVLDIVNENKSNDAGAVDSASNDGSDAEEIPCDDVLEITDDQSSSESSDIEVITRDETNGFTFVDVTQSKTKNTEQFSFCSTDDAFSICNVKCLNQFARSIVIKDVPSNLYHPLLLWLENEHQGSGELALCDRNSFTGQVLVTFKDIEIAESFLKTKKIFDHFVTVCEPLIFEDFQWEMDRSLNVPGFKVLSDCVNEHKDVSLMESNELSLEQQKHENKVDTYEKLMKKLVGKDIENNYKSEEEEKNEEQIDSTKMKGRIACENSGDVKELKDEVILTNHQDSTTDYDTSKPVTDYLDISHTLIVSGVTADDVDAVELYLESSKKGGGHITRQIYDKNKEILEVMFDNEKVAENFIKKGQFNLSGKTFYVLTPDKTNLYLKKKSSGEHYLKSECCKESSKIIEIHNVMSQEVAELIVGLLENPRKGGGPIQQESFCENRKMLFLKFQDEATADCFLQREFIEILDQVYHLCPSSVSSMVNSFFNDVDVKDDRHSHNFILEEEIEPVTEHHGTANSFKNGEAGFSKLNPAREECAQNLLSKQNKKLQEVIQECHTFNVIKNNNSGEEINSEEASIDISQIPTNMTEDTLSMIFESKRYGGGEIKCLKFDRLHQRATITFKEPAVAKSLITKEDVTFKDIRMLVSSPTTGVCKSWDNQQPSSKAFDEEMECSVEVSNIPSDMSEETLMMIFESKRFGGDDVENITFNKESRTAVVTFKDHAVALNMLSKHSLNFNGNKLKITRPSDGNKIEIDLQHSKDTCVREDEVNGGESLLYKRNRTVIISNIFPSVNEETLWMIFESKRYGGGKIERLEYNEKDGTACIAFEDPNVTASILNRGSMKVKDMQILLSECREKHGRHSIACASQLLRPESAADFNTLRISRIPASVSEELISMYFENKNRSGGGSLRLLSYEKRKGEAVIKFEKAFDAQNVCKRKHFLHEATLEVSPLELPLTDVKSCAIEVKWCGRNFTKDFLELYFLNKHRSGGGQVEEVLLNTQQNSAVIVFLKAEDVFGVMQKQPHILDKVTLDVRILESRHPPPLLVEEEDKMRLLAKYLPLSTTIENLKHYIQRATIADLISLIKGDKPGSALLSFSSEPDYASLRQLVCSKPFQGQMISIQRVPYTSSILVTEIPEAALDMLIAMHFENEIAQCMSDMENECQVEMIPEKGCAIVKFKTHTVIQSIISRPHYIEKKLVKVEPYYPWLGLKSNSLRLDSYKSLDIASSSVQLTLVCDVKALHFISQNPKLQKEIEDSLIGNDCGVQWPAVGKQEVKLHFIGKKHLPDRWKETSEKILMAYMDQLTWKKQNVLQETWTDFCKEISAKKQAFNVEIDFDNSACEIHYLGLDSSTVEFEKLLSKVKMSLEIEISRKRKKVTESVTSFKKFQVALLESSVVQKELKMKFNDLQININETVIHLCGIPDEVKRAKLYLHEKISSAFEKSFEVSLLKAKVFVKDAVSLYLREHLIKCGISAAWFCVENNVKVYAFDQSSLMNAIELLHNEIVERSIELKNENLSLFESLSWKEFIAGLCSGHISLEIAYVEPAVVVVCTRNSIDEVMRKLNRYVDEHAVTSRFLQMDYGFVDSISRCTSKQFQEIEKNLKECEGKINKILDGNETGFSISGDKSRVDKAANDLRKLTDNIVVCDHVFDRPGVSAYFMSKQGKEVLTGIQLKHNVSIQVDYLTNQHQVLSISDRYRFEVKPGKFIVLQSGDITKASTEAIVNAANEELKHTGGVAAAIAEAAGPDLEEDSISHVKLKGNLLPGQACITRAGRLPCKRVIHVVGPRWKGGNANEDEILRAAVLSALKIGEEQGLRSIAMPLISTGIFGYPLFKAVDIIVDVVMQYFLANQSTTIREIFFIDNDRDAVDSIERKLRSVAGQLYGNNNGSQRTRICKDSEKRQNFSETPSMQHVGAINMGYQGHVFMNKDIIRTTEGIKITMVKGSISSLKADILVNTTGKELNLSHGNVSKSLLAVAGPALQSECDKKKLRNFDYGDIVVTGGHGLKCQYVYHGACKGWDNGAGNCEKTVRVFMKNVLDRGEIDKQNSVAIPAIGTGNLRIPHKIIADIMFDEVLKFSKHQKPKFLLNIHFVVYDKDIDSIKAFEDKFLSFNQALDTNVSMNAIESNALSLLPYLHPSKEGMFKPVDKSLLGVSTVGLNEFSHNQGHHVEIQPFNLSRIILSIYALSEKTVENVLKDIEDIIKEYIVDKVLETPRDQENIEKLSHEQIQRIKSMASRFSVLIEIEHHHLKRIRIRGAPMDVSSVVDQIHLIFQEANRIEIKKKEEEWIATMAQWEYDDGNDYEKYPEDINAIVEKAFRDGREFAEWEEENAKYKLNFKKMVEEFMTKPGTSPVKVRRIVKEIDIPGSWETMKDDEIFKSILLNSNDDEYKNVARAVMATSQNCFSTIVKIERIQNKMLYKQYLARKKAMNSASPISQNEKILWHGTSSNTVDSINHTGFNRSYCGKNAVLYGRGVYFAEHFKYSAQNQYSPPDQNGIKHIYQSKVLVGEYTVGKQNLIVPPLKPGSTTQRYDSTVDNERNPTIFVIFYDTQAYPEYLVYFK